MSEKNLQFAKETAGAICAHNVATASSKASIGEIRKKLHESGKQLDTLNYIYITDDNGVLVGVVSIKQVFALPAASPAAQIMEKRLIHVKPGTDQEHVAMLALKYKLKSMPVVDEKGKLIGTVPPHTILKILHDEHVEDLLKEAGVMHRDLTRKGGIATQIKQRLPWLLIGTVGGFFAAIIVQQFEAALAEELLLAAFIPAIVYLADATGTQVQTIYIRAYAFGLSSRLRTSILREVAVASVVGVVISGALSLAILFWLNESSLALIVAVSSFISIILSSAFSVLMPWLFIRLKFDPAVASGPFGTIVRDLGSIVIYFLVAEYLLSIL